MPSPWFADVYKSNMDSLRDSPAVISYNSLVESLKNAKKIKGHDTSSRFEHKLVLSYTDDSLQNYLNDFNASSESRSASLDRIIYEIESKVSKAEEDPAVKDYVSANNDVLKYCVAPIGIAGFMLAVASVIFNMSISGF